MNLTNGERVRLHRRRIGMTRAVLAANLGVEDYAVAVVESDDAVKVVACLPTGDVVLTSSERAWLMRRRARLSIAQICLRGAPLTAAEIKAMERGKATQRLTVERANFYLTWLTDLRR